MELYYDANFNDYQKAFDSVNRPALWGVLAHYRITEKDIRLIRMLYIGFSAKVICGTTLTEDFRYNIPRYFYIALGSKQE